tara:strand:+ start:566 stop:937 length:372 start_codon:yes stop_codon:yes gene_type:complete
MKSFKEYTQLAESVSLSEETNPVAYHKKMMDHHMDMAGHHASEREEANDNNNDDLAHDHANDENHHDHAEDMHRQAMKAHQDSKPDAMKKTKEAWKKSQSNAPYNETETPKAHAEFGKKHKLS